MPSQLGLVVMGVLTEQVASAGPRMIVETLSHGECHLREFRGERTAGEDSNVKDEFGVPRL